MEVFKILQEILGNYGAPVLLLLVLIFILLKGQIKFRYPRPEKKCRKD